MDDYKQQLLRTLKSKCKSLGLELKSVQSIYNEAVPGFCGAVDSFCDEGGFKNPLVEHRKEKQPSPTDSVEAYIAETLTDKQKQELPSQFRRIFRSIVQQTHPDTSPEVDSVGLYQEAVEAKKSNKVGELIAITQDLKMDLSHLTYSAITEIESQASQMKDDIASLQGSYPWAWYYSNNSRRGKIIKDFVATRS